MTNPLENLTPEQKKQAHSFTNTEPKTQEEGRLMQWPMDDDLASMTRRELFAAMAMQGACSIGIPSENLMMANIRQCVKLADCLIRVLDEPVLDQE